MNKPQNGVQIKEIAQCLGLSAGTVSFVLNGKGDLMRISKSTQQRVLDKAKELHYQPNIYARRLRKSADYTPKHAIAFLIEERYFAVLLGGFFQGVFSYLESMDEPIDVNLHRFRFDHLEDYFSILDPSRYSGAIIGGASAADEDSLSKAEIGIPFVLFNSTDPRFSSAYIDSDEVGRRCAELFASHGRRRPAIIMSREIDRQDFMRRKSFVERCAELSVPVRDSFIQSSETCEFEDGYEMLNELFSHQETPDCLFIARSSMAMGVLKACRDRRIRIPEDLEIVAYGQNDMLENCTPSVTSIHGLIQETSNRTMELLIRKINSGEAEPFHEKMHPQFDFRESCGGFPKGKGES